MSLLDAPAISEVIAPVSAETIPSKPSPLSSSATPATTAAHDPTAAPGATSAAVAEPAPRTRRAAPQLLADEIVSKDYEELIEGPPSKKGGRLLTEASTMWSHNAWDKVEWDDEQEQLAREKIELQAAVPVPDELAEQFNANPASYWDTFYARVKDGFFNDRAWLRTEFPELAAAVAPDAGPKRIVEIGCGPGNTLFPLFTANENPLLKLHGLDFSKEAVEMVKNNPSFDPEFLSSQVWDLSSKDGLPSSVEPGSVDIAIMIFVMSALHPDEWERAMKNAWDMLKPGGFLLFRDYGRHDMAQLRFKSKRYMQPGLYVRGDNTRVYFFERDELVNLFGGAKAPSTDPSLDSLSLSDTTPTPAASPSSTEQAARKFELLQLGVDRRLLLNRKKQLKMYRVWMQGRWRKPLDA